MNPYGVCFIWALFLFFELVKNALKGLNIAFFDKNLFIKKELQKKMKNKSKNVIYISVIVILSIVCLISIIYNFSGGFYYGRVVEYQKILGEEQTITISGQGSFVTASNFSGTTLLNDDIKQEIFLKTSNINVPLFLRAKIELVGAATQNNLMYGYTNWVSGEDGYLYLNQTIGSNEKIGLCKYVRLSENNKLETNINYILTFIVEASETEFKEI